jgi:uncharacterized protein
MIIDCHYHLDAEMVPLANLVKSMDRHGIDRVALIPRMQPPLAESFLLTKVMAPLLKSVIHNEHSPFINIARKGYADVVRPGGTVSLAGKSYQLFPQPDNEPVAKACAEYPSRFHGWAAINPKAGNDPLTEIKRWIKSPGMIGVKAHPYWHDYPVSMLMDAAAFCSENSKPMIVHLGVNAKGDFRLLPEKFPLLRIIYCHAGVPYPNPVCEYAREKKNVFVDLSSSGYVNARAALKAVKIAGADKCLFGSDGPYYHCRENMFDFDFFRKMIGSLGLAQGDQDQIFAQNFQRIIQY